VQRHQRLVLAHVTRRAPRRLEPAPHRQHQLRPAHQRRTSPRRAHRLVGERVQVVDLTTQRNQVGAGVTQRIGGTPACPQFPTDGTGLDAVIGDPGGDHARSDRILV
jgi:hypothetical protein